MGASKLAGELDCTKEEAQKFIDDFYKGFPKVKKWMDDTVKTAKKTGYAEDFWGRRRRLPDIQLPEYDIKGKTDDVFNPLLKSVHIDRISDKEKTNILAELKKVWKNDDVKKVIDKYKEKGIIISQNGGKIADAERQAVNGRIQSSAATMTKKAMINIYNDEELNSLDFHLLIGVHDELIGECPKENAEKVSERLSYIMRTAAYDVPVPFKCDAEIEERWYLNTYKATIQKEYSDNIKKGLSEDDAFHKVADEHTEMTEQQIFDIINSEAA